MPKGYPTGERKIAATVALKAHNDVKASIDLERGICEICSSRPVIMSYRNKLGKIRWRKHCAACTSRIAKSNLEKRGLGHVIGAAKKRAYVKFKKTYCEGCGFKANYACQLHVDHKDGNHKNDLPDNLWTLCANCHAEKTWLFDQNGAI